MRGVTLPDHVSKWLKEGQIVLGGNDRHVAQIGRQCGQLGLHVHPGPIPAAYCVQCKGMPLMPSSA